MTDFALILSQVFNGFSVTSILFLAALGLALSFGMMRVINMAHGELLMIGGYLAFIAFEIMNASPAFLLLALPLAFFGAAALGALLELTLVRSLYGRPLDTLLATWGVGLILQQATRNLFGPTGVEVSAPSWMSGAYVISDGILQGFSMPWVRLFTLIVAVAVLIGLTLLLSRTTFGLHVRAVNQSREMAASLGVNTRNIDMLVFSLGSGLAGLAGATFALLAPITPTVGQSYIVNAFLVVILGGMGSLVGTTFSSALVGSLSVLFQTFVKVSLALVFLLLFVVVFLQFRPRGLVSIRSRALDESW